MRTSFLLLIYVSFWLKRVLLDVFHRIIQEYSSNIFLVLTPISYLSYLWCGLNSVARILRGAIVFLKDAEEILYLFSELS